MKWDIHCHTTFSDGLSTIREMMEEARKKGLDGIVITDHDFMGHTSLVEKEASRIGVDTVPGVEIGTPYGDIIAIGIERIPDGGLEEMVEDIRQQGGVAIAAHPFGGYWTVQFTELPEIEELFDAWEVLNGGVARDGNAKAVKYAMEKGLNGTAGSDAHFKTDVGSCFIEVTGDVIEAIKKGSVRVGTRLEELGDLAEMWNAYRGD